MDSDIGTEETYIPVQFMKTGKYFVKPVDINGIFKSNMHIFRQLGVPLNGLFGSL